MIDVRSEAESGLLLAHGVRPGTAESGLYGMLEPGPPLEISLQV
jgi:hypothetical protein